MAPASHPLHGRQATGAADNGGTWHWNWREYASREDLVLEGWSEGFMVGSLMLMGAITVANMRRGVLLHKLIFLEQMLALTHGTFCFFTFPGYGWYLSSTATLLYCSYFVHNVVAWMKIRPFFYGRTIFRPNFVTWTTRIYLSTLAATVPVLIFEIFNNWRYFNGLSEKWYKQVRPYEPTFRDPWWVFTCIILFYVISKVYGMGVLQLVRKSPRFGILLAAIFLAMVFTILDIVASIDNFLGDTDGINPWWKLALVFKCLTDAILLDDFKTELKRLGMKRIKRDEKSRQSFALVLDEDDPAFAHDSDEESGSGHRMNGNVNFPASRWTSPSSQGTKTGNQELEFGEALNVDPNRLGGQASVGGGKRSDSPRAQIGRGGTKATKLPNLRDGIFGKMKPRQKSKKAKAEKEEEGDDISPTATLQEPGAANPQANEDLERARKMNAATMAQLSRDQTNDSATRRLRAMQSSLAYSANS